MSAPALRLAAACALCLLPWQSALAADSHCSAAWSIEKGAPSPCDGLLIPEHDARRALRCLSIDLPTCEADLIYEVREAAAELDGKTAMLQASQDHAEALQKQLDLAIAIEPRPWWDAPGVWFGGGLAVGAGVVIAALYAIEGGP